MVLGTLSNVVFLTGGFIAILAALAAALRAVVKVTRVIDGQLDAMKDNTAAVGHLTDKVGPLVDMVADHERRLDKLEPATLRRAK